MSPTLSVGIEFLFRVIFFCRIMDRVVAFSIIIFSIVIFSSIVCDTFITSFILWIIIIYAKIIFSGIVFIINLHSVMFFIPVVCSFIICSIIFPIIIISVTIIFSIVIPIIVISLSAPSTLFSSELLWPTAVFPARLYSVYLNAGAIFGIACRTNLTIVARVVMRCLWCRLRWNYQKFIMIKVVQMLRLFVETHGVSFRVFFSGSFLGSICTQFSPPFLCVLGP